MSIRSIVKKIIPPRALPYVQFMRYWAHELNVYYRQGAPEMLNWAITGACNSKCIFCDVPSTSRHDLSTSQCLNLIDEMPKLGVKKVHLVGGEAFLRKDIWELLEAMHARGIQARFTTNGLNHDQFTDAHKEILARTVFLVHFSLDSVDSDQYGLIRGVKNAFEKIAASITRMQAVGVSVGLTCVVMRMNQDILDLIRFAAERGITSISFQPISADSAFAGISEGTSREDLFFETANNVQDLQRIVLEGKKLARELNVGTNLGLFELWGIEYLKAHLKNQHRERYFDSVVRRFKCQKINRSMVIDYDGSVKACLISSAVCNVKDVGLAGGWKKLEGMRKALRKGRFPKICNGCFCNMEENVVLSALASPVANYSVMKRIHKEYMSRMRHDDRAGTPEPGD